MGNTFNTFNGRSVAFEKELELIGEVKNLKRKRITPKLVSILIGEDPGSKLYLRLKRGAAKRVGAKLEIREFQASVQVNKVIKLIKKLNRDKSVHGIMVQLPLPKNFSKKDRDVIINSIARKKDVDGLRDDSTFVTPVVKAVLLALKEGTEKIMRQPLKDSPLKVCVVGYRGFEGRKIYNAFKNMGYEVAGVDKKTKSFRRKIKISDVVISATGSPGLITQGMVKQNVILIDIGSPKGDIDKRAYNKASFVSPVPGGIGPVTISCLLENIVESAQHVDL